MKSRVRLTRSLEQRVKEYSLAAAGIGAVAFAPSVSAGVIVANLNHVVDPNSGYKVIVDGHLVMNVGNTYSTSSSSAAVVRIGSVSASNKFWGPSSMGRGRPPVSPGALIPGAYPSHTGGDLVYSITSSTFKGFLGNGKFIGFSIGLGANIHYGWVEFNISQPGGAHKAYSVTVVAAGYETIAGRSIAAGATTDTPGGPAPTPAPNSLWLLALGAAGLGGLELLRRRQSA